MKTPLNRSLVSKEILSSGLQGLFFLKNIKRFILRVILIACFWGVTNFTGLMAQTGPDFDELIGAERRALGADFSQFFIGSVNTYFSSSPSFFKKSFYPEWRSLTQYPIDTVVKNNFKDRIRFSLVATSLSESLISYNLLFHVKRETILLPQLSLGFHHTFYTPIYGLPEETKLQAFSPSIILSKSVSHYLKFFIGYRFLHLEGNYRFSENEKVYNLLNIVSPSGTENTTQRFKSQLNYFIIGFSHLPLKNNWENVMSVGIDAVEQNFYYRLEFANKYIAIGFSVNPGSVILFRPFLRIQIPIS